jgi:hypothetical protein
VEDIAGMTEERTRSIAGTARPLEDAGRELVDVAPEAAADGVREKGRDVVLIRLEGREVEVRRHDSRLITVHDPSRRGRGLIDQVAAWRSTRFRGRLAPMGDGSCSAEWTRPFVEVALGEGGL